MFPKYGGQSETRVRWVEFDVLRLCSMHSASWIVPSMLDDVTDIGVFEGKGLPADLTWAWSGR